MVKQNSKNNLFLHGYPLIVGAALEREGGESVVVRAERRTEVRRGAKTAVVGKDTMKKGNRRFLPLDSDRKRRK